MTQYARPMALTRVPALGAEGWFTYDDGDPDGPALLGTRCTACGTVTFPPSAAPYCRNPDCDGTEFEQTRLSRHGTIWSYTDAQYQPPAPFVPPSDPYEPFAIAAVHLGDEEITVLGQLARGVTVDRVRVGTDVEVVIEPLFADDEHEYLVWKWRPAGTPR